MVNRIYLYLGLLLLPSCSLFGYGIPDYVPIGKRNHCVFHRFSDYTCTKYNIIPVSKPNNQDKELKKNQQNTSYY